MAYRIRDWNLHYENNRTRELKRLDWVPIPNRMDGDGYTQLLRHRHGAAHFGAWIALVEIASRCPVRGTLTRSNGEVHTPSTLARLSLISVEVMSTALLRLVDIGWVETYDESTGKSTVQTKEVTQEIPHPSAESSHPDAGDRLRARGNGMELKGKEDPPTPPAPLALALVIPKNGNGHHRKSGKRTSEEIRKALGEERLPWWDAFWAVFPCRESPTQGMDAFERRVHTRELAIELFHGAQRYAKQFEADPTMRLKYAQGWINAERWKDENRVAVNGRPPGKALSFTESVTRAMERRVNAGMEPI